MVPLLLLYRLKFQLLNNLVVNSHLLRVIPLARAIEPRDFCFYLLLRFGNEQDLIIVQKESQSVEDVSFDLLELKHFSAGSLVLVIGRPPRSYEIQNIALASFALEEKEGV